MSVFATVSRCFSNVIYANCQTCGRWLLDNSRIRQLADWTTRGLVNSRTGQIADWTTRGCHRRLCVLGFRSFGGICQSASCRVCDLSSPRVGNPRVGVSASCPVTWPIRLSSTLYVIQRSPHRQPTWVPRGGLIFGGVGRRTACW